MSEPNMFALLIGIDRYSQVPLDDGIYYPHLRGCVRDIEHVEQMLRSRLNLADDQITKRISSHTNPEANGDAAKNLPTYENLVSAFKKITNDAERGDLVYIHYSGHGGRSATMFKDLKGERGLDESLVPCDIGENGACYLRDIEMAYLLKAMSEKGLIVTLVLDSCHSGGATRGSGGGFPRGITGISTTKPPEESSVAPIDEMVQAFRQLPAAATRSVNAASGWGLPTPKDCVIIAACRANELANEFAFDGKERNGALTYWMLDSLRQLGPGYTYKMLYDRVVAKVHSKFVDQTPQLEGDSNRILFSGIRATPVAASANVIETELPHRVKFDAGLAQGFGAGARFAIYPANAPNLDDPSARLAVVETVDVSGTESWAEVVEDIKASEIKEGDRAALLGVEMRLRGRISLAYRQEMFDEGKEKAALDALAEVIGQKNDEGEKWIRLTTDDHEPADFQVAVNRHGEYEIWDANGRLLPNLRPALVAGADGAAQGVEERLIHLTKYRNVRLIDNSDPDSELGNKIVIEIGKLKKDGGENVFQPFGTPMHPLSVGEEYAVRVMNLSDIAVNFCILDLQPDWGISQVFPKPEVKDSELLEPGEDNAFLRRLGTWLPDDYHEGVDILKVFAAKEPTSFSWLRLNPLDQPPPPQMRSAGKGNSIEQLMAAFGTPNLTRHAIDLSEPKGGDWATAQVEVRVRRPSIAHVTDPALSLLQSAFDMTTSMDGNGAAKTRSVGGKAVPVARPELDNKVIKEITQYCVAAAQNQLSGSELVKFGEDENGELVILKETDTDAQDDAQKRGVIDTVKYCASMAVGMAKNLWAAKVKGDTALYDQYKAALTVRMGDCDPNYQAAITQFLKFLKESGHVPYRAPVSPNNFVIEGRLPSDGMVGIVADWATGEPEAIEVLRQVAGFSPQVAIHLGDIYYAGTDHEVQNYFYQPWVDILKPAETGVLSLALPGNHDLYAGGEPFYRLIDQLAELNGIDERPASYFCLRNDDWQLIGLDTALHDRLIGGPTRLENSEVEWLREKMENSGGRRTILLSHHQLFSANDQFDGRSYNDPLYQQLKPFLPQVDSWLWGHEHDLVIFDKYDFKDAAGNVETSLTRGRCIGGSAFPVGNFEMPSEPKNADVSFNRQVALSKGGAFYQHCYTMIKFNGRQATVYYYEDRDGGRILFEETI
ncbi:MAG TPA: caspase family protein [Pyrinomonadaceae bacterium]|nr:caspase family protein [Pyrinomonadaceae bacterium]